jgi:hypothetical protein
VDRRRLLQLWRSEELKKYIRHEARRHFQNTADVECAEDRAWETVESAPAKTSKDQLFTLVYNAIHWMYEERRRGSRNGKCTLDDPEPPK